MRTFVVVALAAVGLVWAGASAQQETRPAPGFGSGEMTVRGTVDVANVPDVNAAQRGEWHVEIGNTPTVVVAPPDFATKGSRYAITWPDGQQETVTIADSGRGEWVQVQGSGGGGRRWVNLAAARAVEESR